MIYLTYVLPGLNPKAPSPKIYREAVKRFAKTYSEFIPEEDHQLILINSNGGFTEDVRDIFEGIDYSAVNYQGMGWDIGAHQRAVSTLPSDSWVMCFSTWAYFHKAGWLSAFIAAREKFGNALYGTTSSYERNLHLRGTGFFIQTGLMQAYPFVADSKESSWLFESGPLSLTQWVLAQGYGAYLVTPDGLISPTSRFRVLDNIYRKGDQSNVWTYDKHTDIYKKNISLFQKFHLEKLANSKFYNQVYSLYLKFFDKI
jgi:hypothetical protein